MSRAQIPVLRLTVPRAAVAIAENLFATPDGALPAAGGWAAGPALYNAAAGETFAVTAIGQCQGVASGAIAKHAKIMVTAAGKIAAHAGNAVCVGRALDAAAADGDVIDILVNTIQ
ncbi:MAG: DUF2190 family protein [Rhodospirillales bacterium]|nr:DUF2190 family protein [Rhodospirillales bacterium]